MVSRISTTGPGIFQRNSETGAGGAPLEAGAVGLGSGVSPDNSVSPPPAVGLCVCKHCELFLLSEPVWGCQVTVLFVFPS